MAGFEEKRRCFLANDGQTEEKKINLRSEISREDLGKAAEKPTYGRRKAYGKSAGGSAIRNI